MMRLPLIVVRLPFGLPLFALPRTMPTIANITIKTITQVIKTSPLLKGVL